MTVQETTPRSWALAALSAGLLAGLSVVFAISYAAMVFSGPLAAELDKGIVFSVLGATILALMAAGARSTVGGWWSSQSVVVAIASIGAADIAAGLPGAAPATLFSTVVLFVTLATFLTGLAMYAAGRLRMVQMAKFIPFPVIGGFLAATGLLLLLRAATMAADVAGPAALAAPEALLRWGPSLGLGAVLLVLARRWPTSVVLAGGCLAYLALFHAGLAVAGLGLPQAAERGLLLGGRIDPGLAAEALSPARFAAADIAAVLAQAPLLLSLAGVAMLGMLVNVSGLETASGRSTDLNRDFRLVGRANMIAAVGSGFVGYPSVSMSTLVDGDTRGRVLATVFAAVLVVALVAAGGPLLSVLPKGLFAMLLAFLGFDMIWRWLITACRDLPRGDYVLLLCILAVSAAFGLVTAVGTGLVVSALLFTVAYSRVDPIRAVLTGRLRLSPTERGPGALALLSEAGSGTLVVELQGYLFFGTANTLHDRIAARAVPPVRRVVLDFRRVDGIDISTALTLRRLFGGLRRGGAAVWLSGMSPPLAERMARAGATEGVTRRATLGDALREIEDDLLAGIGPDEAAADGPMARLLTTAGAAAGLSEPPRELVAGEVLVAQGDASDALYHLEAGRLSAWVAGPPGAGDLRVATFLPGAIVGEIGFCTGTPRTATVRADTAARVTPVTEGSLARARRTDPATVAEFQAALAALLAQRLARTTALVVAMEARPAAGRPTAAPGEPA